MTRKQQQIARIKKLQSIVKKDTSQYTNEDRKEVRNIIEKHVGTDYATDGYEPVN